MLITFEELSQILELDPKNKKIDNICFNTAYEQIKKYLGYELEETNYNELQPVKDNKIILNQTNINEVITIIDQNTNEKIQNYVVDYENKAILFITCKYDGHIIFVNYSAGYTKENLPSSIYLAITNLFGCLKNNYQKIKNGEQCIEYKEMLENIKEQLRPYARKSL